jgi:hypothetical protein
MNALRIRLLSLIALFGASFAHAAVTPESATTEARVAAPGSTYRGTITLSNSGKTPADVKIYQSDYSFSADGRSSFGSPGTVPRSNASWLHLGQEQITIRPGERARVDYEVRVPDDAGLTGTYWSAVLVQEISGAERGTPRRSDVQLQQVMRYAIQVITEIGDTGRAALAFRNAQLSSRGGKRELAVDMENTGERWLQAQVWLELHAADGHLAGRFAGQSLRTFPATSVRHHIDLSTVPPGKYLALLVADGGRNDLFGTQIDLDLR